MGVFPDVEETAEWLGTLCMLTKESNARGQQDQDLLGEQNQGGEY